eukprot:scaffold181560_cov48-Prasinocladus_malaysianus.AAC.1
MHRQEGLTRDDNRREGGRQLSPKAQRGVLVIDTGHLGNGRQPRHHVGRVEGVVILLGAHPRLHKGLQATPTDISHFSQKSEVSKHACATFFPSCKYGPRGF